MLEPLHEPSQWATVEALSVLAHVGHPELREGPYGSHQAYARIAPRGPRGVDREKSAAGGI